MPPSRPATGHPSTAARRRFGGSSTTPAGTGTADRPPAHASQQFRREATPPPTPAPSSSTASRSTTARPRRPAPSTGLARQRPRGVQHRGIPAFRPGAGLGGNQKAVMAEFVLILVIIVIRTLVDYVPNDDKSQPGKVTPRKGLGPIPMAAGACVLFAPAAWAAGMSDRAGRVIKWAGALIIVALLYNSAGEFAVVRTWIDHLGDWNPAVEGVQPVTGVPAVSTSSTTPTKKSTTAAQNAFGAFERAVNAHSWNAAKDALNAIKATGDLTVGEIDALQAQLDAEKAGAGPLPGPAGLGVTLLQGAENLGNAVKQLLGF